MSRHDVIFVGGGFNSLVCAAYLARAGKSVLVIEKREVAGGLVGTDEFSPGFRASVCFQSAELLHPTILSDLQLTSAGLNLIRGGGSFVPDGNGGGSYFNSSDVEGVDREGLRTIEHLVGAMGKVLEPLMVDPLPDVDRPGITDAFDLLKIGWRLRKLGDPDAGEAMRFLPMSVKDILDDFLEDDYLKAALAGPALAGTWLAPRSPGSALSLLYQRPGWVDGLFPPVMHVEGGMGGLADALESAAVAAGAKIIKGQKVSKIVSASGGVTGVEVSDGKRYDADVVVSGVDPKTTMLDLADSSQFDPEVSFAVGGIRSRGSVAVVRYALDSLPAFGETSRDQLSGRIQLGSDLDSIERAFDPIKYGDVPERPWAEVQIPTTADPSLAPEGKHVLTAWVQSVPYISSDVEECRAAVKTATTSLLEEYSPGFTKLVVDTDVRTPFDIEQEFGIAGGCVYHVEPALDQLLYLRPMPGWYSYRTPIRGLYLCGSGTHPGGGLSGLSGKNCATQVVVDSRA
jgi:phytoene dehydrogenase-like protein